MTFSKDGSVVLAADKFGDVLVAPTCPEADGTAHAAAAGQPSAAETAAELDALLPAILDKHSKENYDKDKISLFAD